MAPAASKCTPEQALRYNAIALQIGRTPIYDEEGRIVPIGVPEGKSKRGFVCYIVWDGRCIGVFYNWGTVVAMTAGFTGAAFKGYRSLTEAYTGWLNGPSHTPPRWPPLVRDAMTTHPELYVLATNDTQAADETSTPPPPPAASRPSSPPSSPASLASTATFVSARSVPSPQPLKLGRSPPPSHAMPQSCSPSHIPTPSSVRSSSHSGMGNPAQPPRHLIDTPRTTTHSIASTTTSSIVVSEGRAYAVTIGDVPGVFLDKNTAFLNAGGHPGRVVRAFPTYERAQNFYAKEEQAGRVGLPCFGHALMS
ncbi:hypothetical protein K466DRAFT_601889 [Polyporus arcularius HHB13444]|uniref:Ribonuclease H1 N-terminal domain-containing protein n=1 Tax=Polyporus arcularius HHB13444 TaxID=1314778 RepID=A0A5C3P4K6_9APHY|nr:hypothetical protein K466DRAFT_601889 [Polyporus arcularius HHB13444]